MAAILGTHRQAMRFSDDLGFASLNREAGPIRFEDKATPLLQPLAPTGLYMAFKQIHFPIAVELGQTHK